MPWGTKPPPPQSAAGPQCYTHARPGPELLLASSASKPWPCGILLVNNWEV